MGHPQKGSGCENFVTHDLSNCDIASYLEFLCQNKINRISRNSHCKFQVLKDCIVSHAYSSAVQLTRFALRIRKKTVKCGYKAVFLYDIIYSKTKAS